MTTRDHFDSRLIMCRPKSKEPNNTTRQAKRNRKREPWRKGLTPLEIQEIELGNKPNKAKL